MNIFWNNVMQPFLLEFCYVEQEKKNTINVSLARVKKTFFFMYGWLALLDESTLKSTLGHTAQYFFPTCGRESGDSFPFRHSKNIKAMKMRFTRKIVHPQMFRLSTVSESDDVILRVIMSWLRNGGHLWSAILDFWIL